MFQVLNTIKVQWVTMVTISDLCIATPKILRMIASVRAGCAIRKRQLHQIEPLLWTHSTFGKLVIVCMSVSNGQLDLIFIDAGVRHTTLRYF